MADSLTQALRTRTGAAARPPHEVPLHVANPCLTPPATQPASAQGAAEAFWALIAAPHAKPSAAQVTGLLGGLAEPARAILINNPCPWAEPVADFVPRLPLSIAAYHGRAGVLRALLASPWTLHQVGEHFAGQTCSPAFWAAAAGQAESLRLLHAYSPTLTEPLRGLAHHVTAATAAWLHAHGASRLQLAPALLQAVVADDPAAV